MLKCSMAKVSRALHLLLVGGWLGFTSNATGQDPASSQMDEEMHHDDFLAIGKKTNHLFSKPRLVSSEEAAVPPVIVSAPMSFLFQQRKSMVCTANGIREFLSVDTT